MNDCVKFLRGQVWFKKIDQHHELILEDNPNLIKKDRPYLIISNNDTNRDSPLVTCIPLSLQGDQRYITDVVFYDNSGRPVAIRCGQISTFNKSSFKDGHYMYTLSDEIMNKIDTALNMYLGIIRMPDKELKQEIIEIVNPKIVEDNRPKKKWTYELREQFIDDYEKLGVEETCKKYNFTKSTALTHYYQCRREIKKGRA